MSARKVRLELPIQVYLSSGADIQTDQFFTQADYGGFEPGKVYVAAQTQHAPPWLRYTILQPSQPDRVDSVLRRIEGHREEFQVTT